MAGWSKIKAGPGSDSRAEVASLAGGIVSHTYGGIRDILEGNFIQSYVIERDNERFQGDLFKEREQGCEKTNAQCRNSIVISPNILTFPATYMCTIQENERIAKVSQKRRKEKRIDYSYAKYYYFNPM